MALEILETEPKGGLRIQLKLRILLLITHHAHINKIFRTLFTRYDDSNDKGVCFSFDKRCPLVWSPVKLEAIYGYLTSFATDEGRAVN